MKNNYYIKPAWTHNGSVKTDLPLTVIFKKTEKTNRNRRPRPAFLCWQSLPKDPKWLSKVENPPRRNKVTV